MALDEQIVVRLSKGTRLSVDARADLGNVTSERVRRLIGIGLHCICGRSEGEKTAPETVSLSAEHAEFVDSRPGADRAAKLRRIIEAYRERMSAPTAARAQPEPEDNPWDEGSWA